MLLFGHFIYGAYFFNFLSYLNVCCSTLRLFFKNFTNAIYDP